MFSVRLHCIGGVKTLQSRTWYSELTKSYDLSVHPARAPSRSITASCTRPTDKKFESHFRVPPHVLSTGFYVLIRLGPGARVIIPPRKDAVLSPTAATSPTQRDQHLLEIEKAGRFAWNRTSGYDAQSHAENAFARFKRPFGDRLRTKWDESQKREPPWLVSCAIGWVNGVVVSPMRSAESGVQWTPAFSRPCVQPTHSGAEVR
jgi:hypothetical protein